MVASTKKRGPYRAVHDLAHLSPSHAARRDVAVANRLAQMPRRGRQREERDAAEEERDSPAVGAEICEWQEEHGDAEARADGQSEHRDRERTRPLGRFLDRGNRRDDEGRVHERAGHQLRGDEQVERWRDARGDARDARAADTPEEEPSTAEPVGQCDRHDRDEHADARDREGDAERAVGAVECVDDGVAVLGEQRAAEVGDGPDRGDRGEARRLLRREGHRRDDRRDAPGRRRRPLVEPSADDVGRMLERGLGRQPRLPVDEPTEERHRGAADDRELQVRPAVSVGRGLDCEQRARLGHACERADEHVAVVVGVERLLRDAAYEGKRCVERDPHPTPHVRHATAVVARPERPSLEREEVIDDDAHGR